MFAHDESHKIQCTDVLVDACHDSKENKKKLNVDYHNHINHQKVFTKQSKRKQNTKKGNDYNFISSAFNYCCPFSLDL